MATYAIFRHGSNTANQPMTAVALVDKVEAKTSEEAVTASQVDCYNNQHLSAKLVSRLSVSEREELQSWEELDARMNEVLPPTAIGCVLCGRHPDKPMSRREAENYCCGCQ